MHSRMNAVRLPASPSPWQAYGSHAAQAVSGGLANKSTMAAITQPASDMLSSGGPSGGPSGGMRGSAAGAGGLSQGAGAAQSDGNGNASRAAARAPLADPAEAGGVRSANVDAALATYSIGPARARSTIGAAGAQTSTITVMA